MAMGFAALPSRQGLSALAMLLAAPLAFFGLLASPNAYQAMGIEGAVDCDGPLGVLVFCVPALLVYAPGCVVFARAALATRRAGLVCCAVLCGLVCAGLAANTARAATELRGADHQEVCRA